MSNDVEDIQNLINQFDDEDPPAPPPRKQKKSVRFEPAKKPESLMDRAMKEGKPALVAGALFVGLNLEYVDKYLIKYIPQLFSNAGDVNMAGLTFKGLLSALAVLVTILFFGQ